MSDQANTEQQATMSRQYPSPSGKFKKKNSKNKEKTVK